MRQINYWFIQYDPNRYDTVSAGLEFEDDYWGAYNDNGNRRRNAYKLKEGDLIMFWEIGVDAGFIGEGQVIQGAYKRKVPKKYKKYDKARKLDPNPDKISEVIHVSYDTIYPEKIRYSDLKTLESFKEDYLSSLRTQGTFFPVNEQNWEYFENIKADYNLYIGPQDNVRIGKIKIRKGQSKFRDMILKKYNKTCCICGLKFTELVEAAHIKPWRDSNDKEKGDEKNGICLCSLHHNAFDKGLITFENNGKISFSTELGKYLKMEDDHIKSLFDFSYAKWTEGKEPNKNYLSFHRENIFHKD